VAGCGCDAATVQVQVTDGAGKPLADAVVFLESREARQAVRPAIGSEMAQANKQFDAAGAGGARGHLGELPEP
jgi:hypothetical protein